MKKYIVYKDMTDKIKIISTEPMDALVFVRDPGLLIKELKDNNIPLPKSPVLALYICN